MPPIHLAVELSSPTGRIVAGHLDKKRLEREVIHRFPFEPIDFVGTRRWNLLGLWEQIQQGLKLAGEKFGKQLASIGVHGQNSDYVLLTSQLEMLGLPVAGDDPRFDRIVEHAATRLPKRQLYAATGVQPSPRETLFQLIATKLRDPELLGSAQRLLLLPDFLHWALCGSSVTEFTAASMTQCLNVRTRTWHRDLLQRFDLSPRLLPEIVPAGTLLGPLRGELARQLELPRLNVVSPATFSAASAVAATPCDRTGLPGWCVLLFDHEQAHLIVEANAPQPTDEAFNSGITHAGGIDGSWLIQLPVLSWSLWQACVQDLSFTPSQLSKLLKKAPAFQAVIASEKMRSVPKDSLPEKIRQLAQQRSEPLADGDGPLLRALLESVVLEVRRNLCRLEKITGDAIDTIFVLGRGPTVPEFAQWLADGTGRTTVVGSSEAAVEGNLLIQARAAGKLQQLADLRRIAANSSELKTCLPKKSADWEPAWTRYRALVSEPE